MTGNEYQVKAARTLIDKPDAIYTDHEIMLVWNALGLAISDIAGAIERTDGVECKVSAPGSVWHHRTLSLTPMERMINQATGELFGE
jgi:hypothetical protein